MRRSPGVSDRRPSCAPRRSPLRPCGRGGARPAAAPLMHRPVPAAGGRYRGRDGARPVARGPPGPVPACPPPDRHRVPGAAPRAGAGQAARVPCLGRLRPSARIGDCRACDRTARGIRPRAAPASPLISAGRSGRALCRPGAPAGRRPRPATPIPPRMPPPQADTAAPQDVGPGVETAAAPRSAREGRDARPAGRTGRPPACPAGPRGPPAGRWEGTAQAGSPERPPRPSSKR